MSVTAEEQEILNWGSFAEELRTSEPFIHVMALVMKEAQTSLLGSPVEDVKGREVLFLTHRAYDNLLTRLGSMIGEKNRLTEDLSRRTEEEPSETEGQPSEVDDYL